MVSRRKLGLYLDPICGSCHSVRVFWNKLDKLGLETALTYLRTRPGWSLQREERFIEALKASSESD